MLELLFKIVLTVIVVGMASGVVYWIWTHQIDPRASLSRFAKDAVEPAWIATRDANKLYQDGIPVADVVDPPRVKGSRLTFDVLANVKPLDPQRPVEYQRFRLRIVRFGTPVGQLMIGDHSYANARTKVRCEIIE